MLVVMFKGLLCISMLLLASSCNPCLFVVKFFWNDKKGKQDSFQHHCFDKDIRRSRIFSNAGRFY